MAKTEAITSARVRAHTLRALAQLGRPTSAGCASLAPLREDA